jgi:hypothetical protein
MRVCPREGCEQKYYFRDPGRHKQQYCGHIFKGKRCAEIVNEMGKLRHYQESRRKKVLRQHWEQAGFPQAKIEKLLNGESVRFDD